MCAHGRTCRAACSVAGARHRGALGSVRSARTGVAEIARTDQRANAKRFARESGCEVAAKQQRAAVGAGELGR
eukprot:6184460-Prymnesium_polylepis.1